MKKITFLFLMTLLSLMVSAYDAQIDGIFYKFDSSAKTASVTYGNFYYNSYTGIVTIPATIEYNGVTYDVTTIGTQAFDGCSNLKVTIPNSVTTIGYSAFSGCSGLTSIEIPNSVTTIGGYAFYGCSGLRSVTIPNSVTSIGGSAFSGCKGVTSIKISNSVTTIEDRTFEGCSRLTSVTIPNNVTTIGSEAFKGCSNLSSIEIPNNVTFIDSNAFYGTAWYDNQPDGLIYVGDVAYGYKGTMIENTSVIIKDGTLSISSNAFKNCTGMSIIVIPNSVTSIGSSAFSGCSGLTSLTIPNSVTSIGMSAFSYCSGLTSIEIPNSVKSIGYMSFSGCSGLTSVKIPNSVTSIGSSAFYDCPNLYKAEVNSNSILTNNYNQYTSLKDYFGSQVSEYVLGDEVTSISNYAFNSCIGLNSVTIGNSVKTIGDYAFANFPKLTNFYCYATDVPTVSRSAFQDSYIEYVTLHVPRSSMENYKTAAIWKDFGSIVALEDEPGVEKCATPIISIVDGKLNFSCETEGVNYICRSEFITDGNNVKQPQKLLISVMAIKEGYVPSDAATEEIDLSVINGIKGDVNEDGTVNGTDIQEVINIIVNEE